jgi:hypothetical protein
LPRVAFCNNGVAKRTREEATGTQTSHQAWNGASIIVIKSPSIIVLTLKPMKKIARTLRTHRELLLNWFRAHGELSSGAVEGLNNKVKLVTRKSYGFRTFEVAKLALLHNLGHLPEPKRTHRFC